MMTMKKDLKNSEQKDRMLIYYEYYKKRSDERNARIKQQADLRRLRPSLESYDPKWEGRESNKKL